METLTIAKWIVGFGIFVIVLGVVFWIAYVERPKPFIADKVDKIYEPYEKQWANRIAEIPSAPKGWSIIPNKIKPDSQKEIEIIGDGAGYRIPNPYADIGYDGNGNEFHDPRMCDLSAGYTMDELESLLDMLDRADIGPDEYNWAARVEMIIEEKKRREAKSHKWEGGSIPIRK